MPTEETRNPGQRPLLTKDDLAKVAATILAGESALQMMRSIPGCCTQGCCDAAVLALLD